MGATGNFVSDPADDASNGLRGFVQRYGDALGYVASDPTGVGGIGSVRAGSVYAPGLAPGPQLPPVANQIWSLRTGRGRLPDDAGAGRGFINPPNATAPQPAMGPITDSGINPAQGRSIVTRDGNSFSGKDISGPIAYKDAKTGQITVPQDRVTVLPGVGNYSPDGGVTATGLRAGAFSGTDAALSAARQAAAGRGDWGAVAGSYGVPQPVATAPVDMGGSYSLRKAIENNGTQSVLPPSGVSPAQWAQMRSEADIASRHDLAGLTRTGMETGSTERVAGLNANTQRAINERNVALGLRGQDVTARGQDLALQGHMAANKLGIFNALREQGNWQAGHDLAVQNQQFAERGQREQQLQTNLEKMFTTMDGDKPVVNQQAVQQARQGFDRSVARLGLSGPHQLSPMDEQRLMAGTSLLQKMRENASWLPFTPDKLKTIDPVDLVGMRVLPNGDRQIARKGSNAFGQVIPRRFFTTEEGSRMGDWFGTGTPTNRYDLLSMGQ